MRDAGQMQLQRVGRMSSYRNPEEVFHLNCLQTAVRLSLSRERPRTSNVGPSRSIKGFIGPSIKVWGLMAALNTKNLRLAPWHKGNFKQNGAGCVVFYHGIWRTSEGMRKEVTANFR